MIERDLKCFKKKVLSGRDFETFALVNEACDAFFSAADGYRAELRTLLTDNFQIIGNT